jgi:hypothetical protein
MAFTCQVCFEEKDNRFALHKLTTGNGDVLRAGDCNHPICKQCLASFVTSRVDDQRVFHVRCPFIGCTNEIFEQDVKRMASSKDLSDDIAERFAELRTRDYSAHAKTLAETWSITESTCDLDLLLKLWQSTRLCPRCNLVIERSSGCNSFYCICGHHFDYATAPRVVGRGIDNFASLICTAKTSGLPIKDVEEYGSDSSSWRKQRALKSINLVNRAAAEMRLSREESWQLLQQARSGDTKAREKIRLSRNRGETVDKSEVDGEQDFVFNLWENSTEEAANVSGEFEERPNATIIVEVIDQGPPEAMD